MTLPYERSNAVFKAREFLINLITPSKIPRVPKKVRREALEILKHFPTNLDIELAVKENSKIFGKLTKKGE
jgi:hypothetical protein